MAPSPTGRSGCMPGPIVAPTSTTSACRAPRPLAKLEETIPMKRLFAWAAWLVALLAITSPALVPAATQASVPSPLLPGAVTAAFTNPVDVSNAGVSVPAPNIAASNPSGAASVGWPGLSTAQTEIDMASNTSLGGPFGPSGAIDPNTPDIVGNLTMRHDSAGRLHAVWFHYNADGNVLLYHGVRPPGGNWTIGPIPPSLTYNATPYKRTDLGIGPNDTLYALWGKNANGAVSYAPRISSSTNQGATWSAYEQVPG